MRRCKVCNVPLSEVSVSEVCGPACRRELTESIPPSRRPFQPMPRRRREYYDFETEV